MGKSGNDNYLPIELLYNIVKNTLPIRDMNTEAIARDLRVTNIARFNLHRQSYKVLNFLSYCYFNYELITMVVEVLIEEHKYLRSGDTIPTIHSQVARLETPLQSPLSQLSARPIRIPSSP